MKGYLTNLASVHIYSCIRKCLWSFGPSSIDLMNFIRQCQCIVLYDIPIISKTGSPSKYTSLVFVLYVVQMYLHLFQIYRTHANLAENRNFMVWCLLWYMEIRPHKLNGWFVIIPACTAIFLPHQGFYASQHHLVTTICSYSSLQCKSF